MLMLIFTLFIGCWDKDVDSAEDTAVEQRD
jgi:hypothetical protein